jgi:hypothetical protein
MLQSIECYDANRIVELSSYEIADDGFEISSLDLGLAVDAAAAIAINYQIDRLIRAVGHGTGRPARFIDLQHLQYSKTSRRNPSCRGFTPLNEERVAVAFDQVLRVAEEKLHDC